MASNWSTREAPIFLKISYNCLVINGLRCRFLSESRQTWNGSCRTISNVQGQKALRFRGPAYTRNTEGAGPRIDRDDAISSKVAGAKLDPAYRDARPRRFWRR